jgi:2-C-methyl-D-erythritol 2,4-cyclodiphosphate synthase
MIQARQYQLVNLDAIIIAQRPKMKTFLRQMVETLANRLESEVDRISIKASTTEQLGFIGRGKGIAAQVVVLLEKVETSK